MATPDNASTEAKAWSLDVPQSNQEFVRKCLALKMATPSLADLTRAQKLKLLTDFFVSVLAESYFDGSGFDVAVIAAMFKLQERFKDE